MTKSTREDIFIFIGDRAFTLEELGPAADMRLDRAFQAIIDQGLLGSELVGRPWYEVIRSSGISLEEIPGEEDVLLHSLHREYMDALVACRDLAREGQLTTDQRLNMENLGRRYRAARKLSRP